MSQNKVTKPSKTKAQFIAENFNSYCLKFNFLPQKQIRGKLEEDWKKLYGPKRVTKPIVVKKIPVISKPKVIPKVIINKPEILITHVCHKEEKEKEENKADQTEEKKPLKTNGKSDDDFKSKIISNKKITTTCDNGDGDSGDDFVDNHGNLKKIKRKLMNQQSDGVQHRLRSKKEKMETTIELLSNDNKSIGFIESNGNDTYLKLHSGKTLPWSHSTPVRSTRNNTHLKEISRLPFSPI